MSTVGGRLFSSVNLSEHYILEWKLFFWTLKCKFRQQSLSVSWLHYEENKNQGKQETNPFHYLNRDNYIKWNLLIMEFTIWDSTFGYSVPLCVTLVFLNYLIIWVIKTGFLRHIFIAETSGRFTKKNWVTFCWFNTS